MRLYQLIFTFLIPFIALAQDKPYEFIGLLELNDKSVISYQIKFSINNDNSISGISVSDILGADETKSTIEGRIDKKNKLIEIREVDLVYTKSILDPDLFCNLRFKIPLKKDDYSSNFTGYYPDSSYCIDGKLHLKNIEKMSEFYDKVIKKAITLESKDKIKTEDLAKVKERLNVPKIAPVRLTSNEKLKYTCRDSLVTVYIWDEAKEDGDEVEVVFNNTLYKKVVASATKAQFTLQLNQGYNVIEVRAINQGKIAPNTVSLEVKNSSRKIEINNRLNKNESSYIHIYYKR